MSVPQQTSLHDFKALLAQKNFPGETEGCQETEVASQVTTCRKKVGPRRDITGFSVIQEETEGSKENLLESEE